MTSELPREIQAVIIGGGIIGTSTAYHLVRLGVDVLLLERHQLTAGTTFHAAGLVGQLRTSANITQLLGESVALYDRLEAETGLATGWKRNGGLRLACNADRWIEVQRQATTAHSFGLEMELLTPSEAQALWPLMDIDDLVGAAFLPTDGQANPSDITASLARGARQQGALIVEQTPVTGILQEKGRVCGVETPRGTVRCRAVINCAGQWAPLMGALAGVNVPLVSVQHQYLISESLGAAPDLPTLRDPDRLIYFKEEVGGLSMGGYEPNPLPWAEDGQPDDRPFRLLDFDMDHFEPLMNQALARVPGLADVGIKSFINGPESFTPDGNFILGEAPELRGFFVGAGFNAFGIAAGGGAGMALAEWVARGEPPFDLWAVDIRRFGQPHRDQRWVRARTLEAYARHYTLAWPAEESVSARPCRRSPLYGALREAGACFGEKLGWERPNWFGVPGSEPRDEYSFTRPNWFEAVGEEHRACREAAALFDQSSFAKFEISGPDAPGFLSWICAGRVERPVGRIGYTQLLNDRGGIEADLTVVRVAEDRFYLVTGTGFATRDADWIRRQIPSDARVDFSDVTASRAVLSLMGPRSREILQTLVAEDISHGAFPFGHARELHIAGAPLLALRVSYVGELGWELHIPSDCALTVFEALHRVGDELGLKNAGYRAIETLRLEKGYRAWGADIGPDHTPLEAGLGWAVKLDSGVDFRGRAALHRQRQAPLKKRLAGFSVSDPAVVLLGRETIYRDGERVGWLSSAGFGYTVGRYLGYGYVRNPAGVDEDYLLGGQYELEVAGQRVAVEIALEAFVDPQNHKIRC